jgi:hypothetical protein
MKTGIENDTSHEGGIYILAESVTSGIPVMVSGTGTDLTDMQLLLKKAKGGYANSR